ncbi:MAG: hypothetical protein MGF17_17955 [Trichodesmium sp. MAG_R04]|nr:hypothetical protein [Trichodesmium sp. MAG_R04]
MTKIQTHNKIITCDSGVNRPQVLLKNNVDIYNGNASIINYRSIGDCVTFAVEIEG